MGGGCDEPIDALLQAASGSTSSKSFRLYYGLTAVEFCAAGYGT